MVILKVAFISLIIVSLACAVRGLIDKRRNIGFVILSFLIAVADGFSFAVIDVPTIKQASDILLPYYIVHAWSLFVFIITIVLIERHKRYVVVLILSAITCAYQTYLVISQYLGARVFSFQRRIYFRKAFWVAVDSKNTGLLFSYRSYRICLYINIAIIICVIIGCIIRTHKIFRTRYFAFMVIALIYSMLESIKIHFIVPVWITCIAYNVISLVGLYLVCFFPRNRLREWSLDSFANDMSDGLILYDRFNDLIHLNDMVRNTLNNELLEAFKDRESLKEWITGSTDEDNKEIITYTDDERVYYFKVTVRELGDENSPIGTLYILHDTTDSILQIKVMEKANVELERASQMKSDFLANMSHEIRTPMNAVIGMAEIAMRDKDPQKITDYLLQIQSSGKNLLNIINDILDYSKIESGKMEIIEDEYQPFNEFLDVANVVATRIGDKPVELFFIVEPNLPHKLFGDAMRIRQVLINLVNNAIKFTQQGIVHVHISCEKDPDSPEDVAIFTYHVIDTGSGIKKEDVDKLFVSFQQVDSKRNRSVEGTGLGLAIAKRLVEAMGGSIGVDSEYGKGSDFWFKIPQKIIDPSDDIKVENASEKFTFVLDNRGDMMKIFEDEMKRFGVGTKIINTLDQYEPSGKTEFLFFKEEIYDIRIAKFLDSHKDITGVILVELASDFVSDRPNLIIMRRPESTMGMVHMLNNCYDELRQVDEDKMFKADFTAPQAKILVVDDNAINLTIATELIAPIKAQIDTANGGQNAIDKVAAGDYDIVFMDHMMPEIDGVDATKTIRAASKDADKPVIIALSANVMEEAKRLFAEAGMNDFVAKPVEVKDIITKIKKWLPPEKIIEKNLEDEEDNDDNDAATGELLIECDELDTASAVKALGSASLYNKIAGEYYRSGNDRIDEITRAYDNEDWEDYTIKVHALKSSSRQIGAATLGDMAEKLEMAGKAGDIDTIRSDTGETINVYKSLLEKLGGFFGNEGDADDSNTDKPLIENSVLTDLMDELSEACDNLDLDGMEEISNKLKEYEFDNLIKEYIESLHKAIADIDADECMELIEKIKQESK